jgi:tetratricopeptide (TPR) repeat protein
LHLKDWPQAARAFGKVVAQQPRQPAALLALAQCQGQLGAFKPALLTLDAFFVLTAEGAAAQNMDLAGAWLQRGMAHGALGAPTQALECFEQALSIDPDHVPALLLAGMLLGEWQRHEAALRYFDRASALAPRLVDAFYGRGLVWRSLGEHGKAGREFNQALCIDPTHVPSLRELGNALLGNLCKTLPTIEG